MAHEHNESITDPIPNDAWTNGVGPDHGEENGDQCAYTYGASLGQVTRAGVTYDYNQVINGHHYYCQMMWSNDLNQCLQHYTGPSTRPTATFSATAGTQLGEAFNATGSGPSIADFSRPFSGRRRECGIVVSTPSAARPHR